MVRRRALRSYCRTPRLSEPLSNAARGGAEPDFPPPARTRTGLSRLPRYVQHDNRGRVWLSACKKVQACANGLLLLFFASHPTASTGWGLTPGASGSCTGPSTISSAVLARRARMRSVSSCGTSRPISSRRLRRKMGNGGMPRRAQRLQPCSCLCVRRRSVTPSARARDPPPHGVGLERSVGLLNGAGPPRPCAGCVRDAAEWRGEGPRMAAARWRRGRARSRATVGRRRS